MEQRTIDYEARNAKGYEGDEFIHREIDKLCMQFDIQHIFETGTYHAGTTKRLADFAPIISYEIDLKNYNTSRENIKKRKTKNPILIQCLNSVDGLKKDLPHYTGKNLLFFLDAHWESYCPLFDELKVIQQNGIKPVIIIHDFKVPGKPFGFDSYNGQDFTFEWIEIALDEVYGLGGYQYHYNEQAEGAQRGVIYIYPKV